MLETDIILRLILLKSVKKHSARIKIPPIPCCSDKNLPVVMIILLTRMQVFLINRVLRVVPSPPPHYHYWSDNYTVHRGGSRIFLRRGCTCLLSTSTPINHIVLFFLQNTSCIRKPQVRGGCTPPAPSP